MVLGKDTTSRLEVKGAGKGGVLVRASAGELGKPIRKSSGEYTASYTPPKVNFPQVAVVTWADHADTDQSYGYQLLPLVGNVAFPVKGPAGASVMLKVAGREFGPVELGADGKGKVPIEVPPGVNAATQEVVQGDQTTSSELDLGIPATKRLALVPVPASLPAGSAVKVRVVVSTANGEPDKSAKPEFTASSGKVGAVTSPRAGVYEATFTAGSEPGPVTLSASLGGVDVDEQALTITPALAEVVTLAADPWPLNGDTVKLVATVKDGDVAQLGIDVTGGTAGEPVIEGDELIVEVTEVDPAAFAAHASWRGPMSSRPVRRVVVLPDRDRAVASEKVSVLLAAVDAVGRPVAGAELSLAGAGAPATVTREQTSAWPRLYFTVGYIRPTVIARLRSASAALPQRASIASRAQSAAGPFFSRTARAKR